MDSAAAPHRRYRYDSVLAPQHRVVLLEANYIRPLTANGLPSDGCRDGLGPHRTEVQPGASSGDERVAEGLWRAHRYCAPFCARSCTLATGMGRILIWLGFIACLAASALWADGVFAVGKIEPVVGVPVLGAIAAMFGTAGLTPQVGSLPVGSKGPAKLKVMARKLEGDLELATRLLGKAEKEKSFSERTVFPLENWRTFENAFAHLNRRYDQPVRAVFMQLGILASGPKRLDDDGVATLGDLKQDITTAVQVLRWLQKRLPSRLIGTAKATVKAVRHLPTILREEPPVARLRVRRARAVGAGKAEQLEVTLTPIMGEILSKPLPPPAAPDEP